jgi:transglutaminase superfamily protein
VLHQAVLSARSQNRKAVPCIAGASEPKVVRLKIPSGYRGTMRTAHFMGRLIRDGARDFLVRRTATQVLRRRAVRAKDYLGEIKALFEWVQQNLRYTRDTFQVEVLHSARRLLELRAGDCDDFSILLGSLLESIGHPVRLILTGPNPRQPKQFSHVYLEVNCRGRWIPLDATMPHAMGWQPRTWVREVFAVHRRVRTMQGTDSDLGAFGAATSHPVKSFVRALRGEAIPPRDARVRAVWQLLKSRGVLDRSPWVKGLLRRAWGGLAARPRPRTTQRFVARLRKLGILRPRPGGVPSAVGPAGVIPGRRVALRRVATAQRAPLRPVQAVRMRPVGR